MTCSDVEQALPELLDGEANGAFRLKLKVICSPVRRVSGLVSDLETIAAQREHWRQAKTAAASMGANRIGIARRGLIRDQPADAKLARAVRFFCDGCSTALEFDRVVLAPVAAALVAGGSYVVSHKPATPVAQNQAR